MLRRILSVFLTLALSLGLTTCLAANEAGISIKQVVAGKNNGGDTKYTNFRIPGIIVTKKDTVIMYFEARMTGSDWADMDIVAMRSTDGGETFSEPSVIVEGAQSQKTVNNPIMIEGDDGTVHLLYCVEYGVCTVCNDAATSACSHGAGVFYKKSTDDGITWSSAVNISDSTFKSGIDHNVIATGPGHGICLSDGTLLASVWLVEPQNCNGGLTSHHVGSVSTLYSKDNGATWQIGELVPNEEVMDPNETMLAETSDGGVILNIRSGGGGYRAQAWSKNGYSDWTTMEYDLNLIDPTCMGSVAAYDIEGYPYSILLTNCESQQSRTNLTLKASTDDGKSWEHRMVIDSGSAGYSDLAVDSNGTVYVLYEKNAGVTCNLARFSYDDFLEIAKKQKPRTVPKNSLLLHLDGGSASDMSGYQPDAKQNDVAVSDVYSFNGIGSYMEISPTVGMNPGENGFTYAVSFKLNNDTAALSGQQFLFWYGGVGAGKPQIWCRTRGTDLQCNIASGGVETTLTASNVLVPDKWYHAVIVRDGTEHYLYIDGKLAASKSSDFVHTVTCDASLTLGSSKSAERNRFLNGSAGDIMYYNYALTEDEVGILYTEGTLDCKGGESCPMNGFDDLSPDADYHDGICYVLKNGIMNGVGDGKFAPKGELNRAMLVTVLWRMTGSPEADCQMSFTDVESGTWYTDAVRWAASEGIVNGYSDKIFAPTDSLTREQLALIIFRYADKIGKDTDFSDTSAEGIADVSDISDWAENAVKWAFANGILNESDGKLTPKANATREQVAKAIYGLSRT